ncbi:MAG: hypothetical protein ACE15E_08740 [Acidobacteriota bacterium]
MNARLYLLSFFILFTGSFQNLRSQGDGFLTKDGKRLFTIGWYHMPKEDASLKELSKAGVNLIRCRTREDLDRLKGVGIQGWVPLRWEKGVTDEFKERVLSIADHPALAVWEGPDEVVHNFTAYSGLFHRLKVHEKERAWWDQTPGAVRYAQEKAREFIPNIIDAVSYIRSVDPYNRQTWINEAVTSDIGYVRQYIDHIDITGADIYPIIGKQLTPENPGIRSGVGRIRSVTERYLEIGRGKPVWMILQAFSWPELGGLQKHQPQAYPSFDESRYMAYLAVAAGARGIVYWGSYSVKPQDSDFLQAIYAVTSELSALQPFLVAPNQDGVHVNVNADPLEADTPLSCVARRTGRDWLIAVINETDSRLMSVVVNGLDHLNGMKFTELYGDDEVTVSNSEIILRMKPREVKVYATGKKWETSRLKGRDYRGI